MVGNSSQNSSIVSTSSTTSSYRARAAARNAKLQIEAEALKQKELLEREELLIRQKREEKILKLKREDKSRRKEFSLSKSIKRTRSNAMQTNAPIANRIGMTMQWN